MTKQKKNNKKIRMSIQLTEKTHKKFIRKVKKLHYGVVSGTQSFEAENAIKLWLSFN